MLWITKQIPVFCNLCERLRSAVIHVHRQLWSRKWKIFVYNSAVLFRLLMIHVHEEFPRCPVCTHWRVIQDKLFKNLYTKIWFCFQNNVLRWVVIKNGNSRDRRDGLFSRPQILFLVPVWWFIITCNFNPRGSNPFFWSPVTSGMYVGKTFIHIKYNDNREWESVVGRSRGEFWSSESGRLLELRDRTLHR